MRGASRAWSRRVALAALAVGGSALYARSFPPGAFRFAWPVAVAAGLSWPVFGAALLVATRMKPSVLAWAEACLAAMGLGILVLLASVALNAAGAGSPLLHVLVLVASNAAMAVAFTLRARRLGLRPRVALALWIVALDGVFLALVAVMA